MTAPNRIIVCQSCTWGVPKEERTGVRGGEVIHDALVERLADHPLAEHFRVEKTGCLSSCTRSCTVAFDGPGKHCFVFAELKGAEDVDDLLDFAGSFLKVPNGKVRKNDRPEKLRDTVVARVPPLP